MANLPTKDLAGRTSGPVWTADLNDRAGYDGERSGFNLALDHRPALVLAATAAADMVEGVRFAGEHALPVDIQATGHGAHQAMDEGLLITTRHLTGVQVDPQRRVARISAGATAADVLAATTPHGLAAPVGAAPGVGYVSYSLGGGLGPLGRSTGYAADYIRRLDVVTADGAERTVTANECPELFWALRGGGGNLAAVTAIEVDLLPIADIYGGGLYFPGDRAEDVLQAFERCIAFAPAELSLSIAFLTFPNMPALPAALRGRHCGHVRVAHLGDADTAEQHLAGLRALTPLLDTVRRLPMSDVGTIHADPTAPTRVHSNSVALTANTVLEDVVPFIGPSAPFVLELRHLGASLANQPAVPNAVGHRSARLNLFTSAYPTADPVAAVQAQQRVYDALAPASAGGPLRTFLPTSTPDASACYETDTATELAALKTAWDPGNLFRFAPAITAPGTAAHTTPEGTP